MGRQQPGDNREMPAPAKAPLDAQQPHWEAQFAQKPEMFGDAPSDPARKAAALFTQEGRTHVLELGPGQGRDSIFFAQSGLCVTALDYSQAAVDAITEKARAKGLAPLVTARRHDVREPLPFEDGSFDACFSHMLYCMALTTRELERLSAEIRRVLKPGGLNIYTVRHTGDPGYGAGIHRGEDLYEANGFIVHFFSREKVTRLAQGYTIVGIDAFEEGRLPRRLFRVTLRKQRDSGG